MGEYELHSKIQKLFKLMGHSQSELARRANVPVSTVHEFLFKDKNISSKTFMQILGTMGVNVEKLVDNKIHSQMDDGKTDQQFADDVAALLTNLDKYQRHTSLTMLLHLNKMGKSQSHRIKDVTQRIEGYLKQL